MEEEDQEKDQNRENWGKGSITIKQQKWSGVISDLCSLFVF